VPEISPGSVTYFANLGYLPYWVRHSVHSFLCGYALQIGANRQRMEAMLWTIFVILLVLWLLGVVSAYTLGSLIHLLLLITLAVLLIHIIEGLRPLA
jgi:hypothetical protein